MKKYSQGFIFLITLMMTSVISLLVLAFMQHLLVYQKFLNQEEKGQQEFHQLETLALKLVNTSSCITHSDSANGTVDRLLHKEGCVFKNYRYYIEDLGTFSCLTVNIDGKNRATNHRRISIVQLKDGIPYAALQVRFINASSLADCPTTEHAIKIGLSSWRYIVAVDENFL
jgi:hypothetical protein